jgi:DNA polymerase-3 subunit delta
MEYEQILDNLKKKIYHPVYFLSGEEPYFIDLISDYIEANVLPPEQKGFNQSVFYGKDTDIMTVLETCRRYPMMADHQVIIVKEAQAWKDLSPLARYLKAPSKTTILVIGYKNKLPDKLPAAIAEIGKSSIYLDTKKLRDYQVSGWIEKYLKNKGYSITPQASQMMTDFLGNDLSKIVNELKKLFIVLDPGAKITPDDIEKNIGFSKEFNLWELGDALGVRDVLKANRIIAHFGSSQGAVTFPALTGFLFNYFVKLFEFHFMPDKSEKAVANAWKIHPFIAKSYVEAAKRYSKTRLFEIIGIIREYDMKSKGLGSAPGVSPGDLMKEMVYKILH